MDAVFAFKQGTASTTSVPENPTDANLPTNANESTNEDQSNKRRLRSHKNEENEMILDLGAVSQATEVNSNNSTDSGATSQTYQMSSMTLLRQLLPTNMAVPLKTRELLQDILSWQLLPSDSPVEASHIYGISHLARLIVKLPDFLNLTPFTDEKLKLLLQHISSFIEYVSHNHTLLFRSKPFFHHSY